MESLDSNDLNILRILEKLSSRRRHTPVEVIEEKSRIPSGKLAQRLEKLSSLKLIEKKTTPTLSYALTIRGLDILALADLRSRGVIGSLGERIGVGKEGVSYHAKSPDGEDLVLKFHRGGMRSFRRIRIFRRYASETVGDYMAIAKLSAEREFKALVSLKAEGARVPDGVALSRHALVQEFIPGVELYKVKPGDFDIDSWRLALTIIDTMRIAYTRVGIVHGDLSEYNVIVDVESSEGYVIDWPQYVYRDDVIAEKLLRRDVSYIVRYFRRKWGLDLDPEKIVGYVKGDLDELR